MKNDTCVICGENFEPRENKKYCSDKCAQYAYRQKNKVQTKEIDNLTPVINPDVDILYTFDSQEYLKVKEKLKVFKPENVIEYAFFRKNLTGILDLDFIAAYIDEFFPITGHRYDCNNFYDEEHPIYKEFKNFEKLFYEGRILIKGDLVESEENTSKKD
jgi:hypothetical protein